MINPNYTKGNGNGCKCKCVQHFPINCTQQYVLSGVSNHHAGEANHKDQSQVN